MAVGMRVPILAPQLEERQLPGVRQNLDVSNRGLDNLGRAVQDIGHVVQKELDQQNSARAEKFYADGMFIKSKLMREASEKLGENALDIQPTYTARLKEELRKLRDGDGDQKGLSNDVQRAMADNITTRLSRDFDADISTHVSRQTTVVRHNSAGAAMDASSQDLADRAMNGGDEVDLVKALAPGRAALAQLAKDEGWGDINDPKSEASKRWRQYATEAHSRAIEAMSDTPMLDRVTAAREYFNLNRADLDGKTAEKIDDLLKTRETHAVGVTSSSVAWEQSEGDEGKAYEILDSMNLPEAAHAVGVKDISGRGRVARQEVRAKDSPLIVTLDDRLLRTGTFSLTSGEFLKLSLEGQNKMRRALRAEERSRSSNSGVSGWQNKRDAYLKSLFRSLDTSERANYTDSAMFAEHPELRDASAKAKLDMVAMAKTSRGQLGAKGLDISANVASEIARHPEWKKKTTLGFKIALNSGLSDWREANPGKALTFEDFKFVLDEKAKEASANRKKGVVEQIWDYFVPDNPPEEELMPTAPPRPMATPTAAGPAAPSAGDGKVSFVGTVNVNGKMEQKEIRMPANWQPTKGWARK